MRRWSGSCSSCQLSRGTGTPVIAPSTGTPYAVAERGLKLFAKEVLPVVKAWKMAEPATPVPVRAAE